MSLSTDLRGLSLDFDSLREAYRHGLRPEAVVAEVYRRIAQGDAGAVWTQRVPEHTALEVARQLDPDSIDALPLYGIPFSVKDNIHVQGLSTSAGCAAFAHDPEESASVVRQAIEAGAILIGKNTMDEFATGLVGIRSEPHPVNPFDSRYIPGGSSSGSAVAVACGWVGFSLGTDTGGSGRIPAALNNIVGLKTTPGAISNDGLVYAHRSFDCVPIFALSCSDADDVFKVLRNRSATVGFNSEVSVPPVAQADARIKVGIPAAAQMNFFGDGRSAEKYQDAVETVRAMGWEIAEIDFEPFRQSGTLLFLSSLVAERFASIGAFVEAHPTQVNSAVLQVISRAHDYSAVDVFNDYARLQDYRHSAYAEFSKMDLLMVPTAGTIYTIEEVKKDPINLNNNMGYYTYFANLLRLPVVATPCGLRSDNLPFGVSFVARPGADDFLIEAVKKFEATVNKPTGVFNADSASPLSVAGSAP